MCNEGCLPLVPIFDADVVVSPLNVELGKVVSIFQLIHKVGDKGKGIGITSGVFVKITVVLTGVEFAVFLLDKEERRYLGGTGRMNLSCG